MVIAGQGDLSNVLCDSGNGRWILLFGSGALISFFVENEEITITFLEKRIWIFCLQA